jgi:hypothetical protein
MNACATEEQWRRPISEDIVDAWLLGLSALRSYLTQRRAGHPVDTTMETLLCALLRSRLGESADVERVIQQLVENKPE